MVFGHRVVKTLARLKDSDPDKIHVLSCPCETNECSRCLFATRKLSWKASFQLDPANPKRGSWLESRGRGKGWSLLCKACCAAGARTIWTTPGAVSSDMRKSRLALHASKRCHQLAVAKLLGTVDKDAELYGAPSSKQFLDLLHAVRAGRSYGKLGLPGSARRRNSGK